MCSSEEKKYKLQAQFLLAKGTLHDKNFICLYINRSIFVTFIYLIIEKKIIYIYIIETKKSNIFLKKMILFFIVFLYLILNKLNVFCYFNIL